MDPARDTHAPPPQAPSSSSHDQSSEAGSSAAQGDVAVASPPLPPKLVRRPTPSVVVVPEPTAALGGGYSRYPQTGTTPIISPITSAPQTASPVGSRQNTRSPRSQSSPSLHEDDPTPQPTANSRPSAPPLYDHPSSFDSALRPQAVDYVGIGAGLGAALQKPERVMSAGRNALRRELSTGRTELGRELSVGESEAQRELSVGRDELRREYTSGRDEVRSEYTNGRDELRRNLTSGRDEIRRDLNSGRDALTAEVNLGQEALRKSEITLQREVSSAREALRRSEDALKQGRPLTGTGATLGAFGRSLTSQAGNLGNNLKEAAESMGKNLATNAAEAFVSRVSGLDHVVPVMRTEDLLGPSRRGSLSATVERTVGQRLEPTLIHAREELRRSQWRAKWTGNALNVAIGAQVVFGALTTGIAAATSGRQTAIATSVLGGMSTLAASYLARARGSGEPEISTARCKDIENFIRDGEAFVLDHGHLVTDDFDMMIDKYRRRFEEIIGNGSNGVGDPIKEKTSPPV